MSKHASYNELSAFIGWFGIMFVVICYLCYTLILNIIQ